MKRGSVICWLTSLRRVMAETRKPRILASDQDHPLELTFDASRRRTAAVMYWMKRKAGVMDLIITLIVGGIIGWLASIVMKTNAQMGLLANVIVGIVGSLLGYWLAGVLGIAAAGPLRWIIGVLGAAALIGILKALNVFK